MREYNKRLSIKFITHYLLFTINITGYKKSIYFILITPLNIYNIILKKSWINKYNVFLNIIKNKILFILKRYDYEKKIIFLFKNLIFLAPSNYVLLTINVYLLIRIFRKVFINFFLKLFKFIMKDSKFKYNNNLFFNKIRNILNIYEIAALSILKYGWEKIY